MKTKQAKPKSKKALFLCQVTDTHVKVLKSALSGGGKRQVVAVDVEALPQDTADAALSVKLSGIFKEMQYGGEPVIVSLPRKQVTSRYLKVPATDPQEVEKMAALQTVRFLPYQAEDLVSGFQILGEDAQGYSEVSLVIAHKDAVERYVNIFKEIKASLSAAVLSSAGLIGLYHYLEPKEADPVMLIDVDGDQAEAVIALGQKLIFSRSFKVDRAHPDWPANFSEEIAKTNDLYVKETSRALPQKAVVLSTKKINFQSLTESLKLRLNLAAEELPYEAPSDVADVSLASLIGLSLAPVPETLNLLPAQLKEAARSQSKYKQRLQLALACIAIAAMFAFGMSRSLENKVQYLKKLKARLAEVSKEAAPLAEIEKRFGVIERYAKKETSCLDVLYALYNNIPQDISLVSFTYEDSGSVTIHGQAPALSSVFNLVNQLEKAPAFRNYHIKVRYATKKNTTGGEVIDFEIVC